MHWTLEISFFWLISLASFSSTFLLCSERGHQFSLGRCASTFSKKWLNLCCRQQRHWLWCKHYKLVFNHKTRPWWKGSGTANWAQHWITELADGNIIFHLKYDLNVLFFSPFLKGMWSFTSQDGKRHNMGSGLCCRIINKPVDYVLPMHQKVMNQCYRVIGKIRKSNALCKKKTHMHSPCATSPTF